MPTVLPSLSILLLGKMEWALQWLVGSCGLGRRDGQPGTRRSSRPSMDSQHLPWHLGMLILFSREGSVGETGRNPGTSPAIRIPAVPLSLTLICASGPPQCPLAGPQEKEGEAGLLVCPGTGSMSPARPSSEVCLHSLLSPSPPTCPSGRLGRHCYCPQFFPPAGLKGGVTHSTATSPRLASSV